MDFIYLQKLEHRKSPPRGLLTINQKLLNSLPELCGVCFIKKSYFKMGIAVAHEGILIDQKNLVHASSEYRKTVNIDFMDYYFKITMRFLRHLKQ